LLQEKAATSAQICSLNVGFFTLPTSIASFKEKMNQTPLDTGEVLENIRYWESPLRFF